MNTSECEIKEEERECVCMCMCVISRSRNSPEIITYQRNESFDYCRKAFPKKKRMRR